ncbi:alpha/beta hydrolase [Cellulomonas endophytica]|uniref:alpha/beta hydrolase n=1 Tax=Cellulomonas endophytica TaxID=2494735 RepID=UPI0010105BFF|nr:alpha/beta hydrolase [Cellulomonas endophytica]
MTTTTAAEPVLVPARGARIATYRLGDAAAITPGVPPLLLVGSPMDSTGFGTLASHFPDRLVVLVDPRNTGRSERDDPSAAVTVEQHAEDLHAVVEALGDGPVDLFGSSGGATNGLALVAAHPDDVRLLVAHEPPLAALLPDADGVRAATEDILAAYDAGGSGPAMARFIALVSHRGPVDADFRARPAPDPAAFGLPTTDDGTRDDPLMANMRGGGVGWTPDLEALRAARTRVVVAVGEESGGPDDGEMAGRGGHALAAALGRPPVVLPGGHAGFLGGEYGQTGRPVEFARALRAVLAGDA